MMSDISSKITRIAAAAVLAAVVATGTQAATILVSHHSTNRVGNTADQFASSYSASVPAGASWDTDPTVTPPPGSIKGVFKSPFDKTALADTQSYFSVGGTEDGQGAASSARLIFDSVRYSFDMLWGSIDSHNVLEFYLGQNLVYSLDGNMLASKIGVSLVTKTGYEEVSRVRLYSINHDGFDNVKFSAEKSAFEFALDPAHTPIPAAGLMLLSALGAIAVLRRRKSV